MISSKIGAILLSENLITQEQLEKALEVQKKEGGRLGSILIKLGYVDEKKIAEFLSKQYSVPYVDLSTVHVEPKILNLIPKDLCRKFLVVPFDREGQTIKVAIADPSNVYALEELRFVSGFNVRAYVAVESSIREFLDKQVDAEEKVLSEFDDLDISDLEFDETEEEVSLTELKKEVEDAPIVKLVNYILTEAVKRGASDIHVEPYEKDFRVRFRIDGVMHEFIRPPKNIKDALTSRLKILAELDIAERRLPQDGRIKIKLSNKTIDMRVSTLPVLYGEKVVLRILDKSNLQLDLEKLGFEPESLKVFLKGIESPYGMVLVTGPTGSGKSTTLYSALSRLNKEDTNIMTAEDPVEYNIFGINQVQMKEEIGLNFAAALRSFLRQDPDIIMVGEIRDYETAEIAIKAALTGHLVLSTLHTNDAPSTINRLLNMGIEPFLVASSTVVILAQRLARKICKNCAEKIKLPQEALLTVGFKKEELNDFTPYRGKGCDACNGTGYKGRVALYEVMGVTDSIKELILRGATAAEIKEQAVKEGMLTLRRSGLEKVKTGLTSIEEVVRVTFAD
ncbi:type IV-A pilus assembly ATPase PilB [Deferribacterales bacterium Es71-Z0220]|uniref:type IV-A pilus assembly ATPase PilB n=1 Tax=Deferrivibrio essentukiensis TaxID=2880922 RepID=UPI001F601D5A|nr:type IV-A pilus assembly ATPase PilB [Deferrivibrio essentukiensis]MCB4204181.1 type IV-A pilus assembly ATPase PilB [Deferrivibrio essentukiensis]